MENQKQFLQRVTSEGKTSLSNLGSRCFHDRLGSASRSYADVMCLVKGYSPATYELLKNDLLKVLNIKKNCQSWYSTLSKGTEVPKGVGQDRQHHCNDLHQQTRRDSFSIPMYSGLEHVPVDHQEQHCLNCSLYSWKSQHIGRSSVSKIHNTSNRVDAEQSCCTDNIQYVGKTTNRPVCNTMEFRPLCLHFQTN